MSDFVLKTDGTPGVTSVSNLFLDYYMPGANGEYVKVYLYLLRALNCPDISLSVAGLADVMDKTESDILRALKYWEKQGILSLECDDANTLQGIYLCTIPDPVAKKSEGECHHLSPPGERSSRAKILQPGRAQCLRAAVRMPAASFCVQPVPWKNTVSFGD